jgi:hypothetical protein
MYSLVPHIVLAFLSTSSFFDIPKSIMTRYPS